MYEFTAVYDTIGCEWKVVDATGDKATHRVFLTQKDATEWIIAQKHMGVKGF